MRIIVFSDTHGTIEPCVGAIGRIKDIDLIIHCGDHWSDARDIGDKFKNIPVKYVRGNCDFALAPIEEIVEAEGKKILVTHGHMYNVKEEKGRYETLKKRGLELGCDAVVFGHTHIAYNENFGNIVLMNPGSAKYGMNYGIIEIENGVLKTAVL